MTNSRHIFLTFKVEIRIIFEYNKYSYIYSKEAKKRNLYNERDAIMATRIVVVEEDERMLLREIVRYITKVKLKLCQKIYQKGIYVWNYRICW